MSCESIASDLELGTNYGLSSGIRRHWHDKIYMPPVMRDTDRVAELCPRGSRIYSPDSLYYETTNTPSERGTPLEG